MSERLWSLSVPKLEEILTRESALLQKRQLLLKLPDKGAKLRARVADIKRTILAKKLILPEGQDDNQIHLSKVNEQHSDFQKIVEIVESNSNLSGQTVPPAENCKTESQGLADAVPSNMMALRLSQSEGNPEVLNPSHSRGNAKTELKMWAGAQENKIRKFVPNQRKSSATTGTNTEPEAPAGKSVSDGMEGLPSPKHRLPSSNSDSDTEVKVKKKCRKWDEALLFPQPSFGPLQSLTLRESIQLTAEKLEEPPETTAKKKSSDHPIFASALFGIGTSFRKPKPEAVESDVEMESDISDDDWESSDRDSSVNESDGGDLADIFNVVRI